MKTHLAGRSLGQFRERLLKWFRAHQRDLPWRSSRDPYRIWVAEIMLQQTRIAAVMPYYERFLERFPSVQLLADAPQQEVLKLWSGLGYYSRARNLHLAAKKIVAEHEGKFPRGPEAALKLPGIGVYTAAAVLSIAYDVPLAVLDGNVARVLARIDAIHGDLRAPRTWRALTENADRLLAQDAASDWNQALMELGEVICTPKSPRCLLCPVLQSCRAYAEGITHEIPAPRKKRAPVSQTIAALILLDAKGRTLLVKDPGAHDDVLFSRMWQFPAIQVSREAKLELEKYFAESFALKKLELEELPSARHGVTFRSITLLPFLARVAKLPKPPRSRILELKKLETVPVSSATKKLAAAVVQSIRKPS
ncbi:MAG TPA: A/G-specific adenine glycosylase [Candidatus Acidoferrales bacterium]